MYAIIEAGGKQHRVVEGETLRIDLMKNKKAGDELVFDRVLMLGGEDYKVGAPLVEGAKVVAKVTNMGDDGRGVKGVKVWSFKKRRRHGYEKTIGHRQRYTEVRIEKIEG